jgi:p24 family protein delta-1
MRKETLVYASRIHWIQVYHSRFPTLKELLIRLLFIGVPQSEAEKYNRIIDLDVDIGAEAVDYKYVLTHLLLFLYPLTNGVNSTSAIAAKESLSGLETEMLKLEGLVKEIVDEMSYLKAREMRFQSTNREHLFLYNHDHPHLTPFIPPTPSAESTNKRVQNFALLTFCALVVLGIWQIFHLRAFFKRKYLID